MFFFGFGENKDVIKIYNAKVIDETSESSVDISLERGRGVNESYGHNNPFEVAIANAERCLPLVTLTDADPIVSIL